MNDTPAPEAPEQSIEGAPAKREAKPIPASLSEFLSADKASARRFVQALSKRAALTDDDLTRSRDIVDKEPAKLSRVVELTRAAADAVPPPGILLRWCEQILRSRDGELRDWALDPAQDAVAAFRGLLGWAYPAIHSKGDRSKRQLGESCLLIGLSLLAARRALPPLDALRALASASGVNRERRGSAALERRVRKQLMRLGVKQLFELAGIAALSEEEITAAANARRTAIELAEDLRGEMEALENAHTALSKQVQDLDQELGQRDNRIRELVADLTAARARAFQDLDKLKARFRREIGDGLAGLLADAWDALDTDPPHPNVARERLEIAREAIQREIEWLSRSSD